MASVPKSAPPNITKMSPTWAKQRCWIEWRALITQVPFLPSFLPSFAARYSPPQKTLFHLFHVNLFVLPSSFTLALISWQTISAGHPFLPRVLQPLDRIFFFSSHLLIQRTSPRPRLILPLLMSFVQHTAVGVGVNFHSIEDVDKRRNSDNDATAVASMFACFVQLMYPVINSKRISSFWMLWLID